MVEVRLHGALAAEFGRQWQLDIRTPREAVDAIECGRPGFKAAIMALDKKGMVFRVRSKNHDYDDKDVDTNLGTIKRVDIIPIVRGASAGLRFVVGAVLAIGGYLVGGPLGYMMMSTCASLMLGAVTDWLTPRVKKEDEKNVQSWSVVGPSNIAEQGMPVPIIYGEVLTGGLPISAGITVSQVDPGGSVTPSVSIGGNLNPSEYMPGYAFTLVLNYSASPFNVGDPLTYVWTVSGFALASVKRVTKTNQASVRIELDYPAATADRTDTGTVMVQVSGKNVSGDESTINVSKTETVTVFLGYYDPSATVGGA